MSPIQIYGCTAFVHIPKQLQTEKSDVFDEKQLFLGIANGNAFRILLVNSLK